MKDLSLQYCEKRNRAIWAFVVGAFLVVSAVGCGDDAKMITIPPFAVPSVDMVVNDTYSLVVELNEAPSVNVEISAAVESKFQNALELSTATLSYPRGKQTDAIRVTALESTDGEYATVTFTVDESGFEQIWRVRVEEQ